MFPSVPGTAQFNGISNLGMVLFSSKNVVFDKKMAVWPSTRKKNHTALASNALVER